VNSEKEVEEKKEQMRLEITDFILKIKELIIFINNQ